MRRLAWLLTAILVLSLVISLVISCASVGPPETEQTPVIGEDTQVAREFTAEELVKEVIKANSPLREPGIYRMGMLSGMSPQHIIRVKDKIDGMQYNERPSGPTFYIWFTRKGANGTVSIQFGDIPTMRVKELILKGLINEGDEVTIQGECQSYEIDYDKYVTVHIGEASFVEK